MHGPKNKQKKKKKKKKGILCFWSEFFLRLHCRRGGTGPHYSAQCARFGSTGGIYDVLIQTEQTAVSDCFPFLSCFEAIIRYLFLGCHLGGKVHWCQQHRNTKHHDYYEQSTSLRPTYLNFRRPDRPWDFLLDGYREGGGIFRGVKLPGREADHLLPCSAEVKN